MKQNLSKTSWVQNRTPERDLFYEQACKLNAEFDKRAQEMPVLTIAHLGVTAQVTFDRRVEERPQYLYRIFGPSGPSNEPIIFGDDIRGPFNGNADLADAFETLLSFLGAWQEASQSSENWNLFDNDMRSALDWDSWLGDLSMTFQ